MNWIRIASESLNLIRDFIEAFSFDEMLHGTTLGDQKLKQFIESPTRYAPNPRINTLSPLRDAIHYNNDSRLKSPSSFQPKNSQQAKPVINNAFQKVKFIWKLIEQFFLLIFFLLKFVNYLKNQKLLSRIYKENQNSKTQALFADSFIIIQALKGLSNLVMKSFTEDQYGIVQQTLPDILTTFIQLQKVKITWTNNTLGINWLFQIFFSATREIQFFKCWHKHIV